MVKQSADVNAQGMFFSVVFRRPQCSPCVFLSHLEAQFLTAAALQKKMGGLPFILPYPTGTEKLSASSFSKGRMSMLAVWSFFSPAFLTLQQMMGGLPFIGPHGKGTQKSSASWFSNVLM
jgi:hypothetical protein